ncbi:MAG: fumarylacetoacetate hydrolase family protein [Bacteroidetes bacterium]|nr:fumarylacetoacetate hydrolase family protein [Rhodothermia bacterium]MCX7907570.1 fumarylacetoacetate hydrolase family protein [Bacteroidota bacterium]MDW8284499.1 fumarylacetoacetate hydrolase family protein [Bacteroidota bacterium]
MKVFLEDVPVATGTIFCIGRNYAEHAREMRAEVPEAPIVFLKPVTALCTDGQVWYPPQTQELHHEVELVVLLGRSGQDIPEQEALAYVAGYGVGIDFTARDLQEKAKRKGHPWALAKGFDSFAPVSRFVRAERVPDPHALRLQLWVNGELRQSGYTGDMLYSIPRLIAYLSSIFTLQAGDLLFTGTPAGVGPVRPGDELWAVLEGLAELRVQVGRKRPAVPL